MALESFLASKAAPYVIQGGLTGIAALKDLIAPSRAKELEEEVLEGYSELRRTAQRQARGQFDPQEREQIRAAAQPQLQQVAGTIASRGLGSSPAGAQIAANAEQQVFSDAQLRAQQMEQVVNRDLFNMTQALINGDQSFLEDLQAISKSLFYLRERGAQPDQQEMDALNSVFGMEGYTRGVDSRGDEL